MTSSSPHRMTFQKESYIKRCQERGETPDPDYLDMYESSAKTHDHRFDDPESRINNLEDDLLTPPWILEKARTNEWYAQNIYASLCNNDFTKIDVLPILADQRWSCSWRYAGGVVADMLEEGDYIDWYCSGIRDTMPPVEDEKWTPQQIERWEKVTSKYVGEGAITQEIRDDFAKLGWFPAAGGDWENFE